MTAPTVADLWQTVRADAVQRFDHLYVNPQPDQTVYAGQVQDVLTVPGSNILWIAASFKDYAGVLHERDWVCAPDSWVLIGRAS